MKFHNSRFLASSGISVFGSALTDICLLTFAASIDSIRGISLIVGITFLAIAISGFLSGILFKYFNPISILRFAELARVGLVGTLFFLNISDLTIVLTIAFLLNLCDGFYHPIRQHYINSYFSNFGDRNSFIAKLQSIDNSLQVVGPLIAGIALSIIPIKFCFLLDSFTYLVSFVFWLTVKSSSVTPLSKSSDPKSIYVGYKTIFANRNLIFMNIARLIGNYVFVYWKLMLPVLLLTIDNKEFSFNQGLAISFMAMGLFLTNYVPTAISNLVERFNTDPLSHEKFLLKAALIPVVVCIPLLILAYKVNSNLSLVLIFITAILFGVSNAGFRTGGILIGMRITPRNELPFVISAADSVIRPFASLMTYLVALLLGNSMSPISFYILTCIVPIAGLIAFIFYQQASKINLMEN